MLNMKKIIKLTESDLVRIVKRVITEANVGYVKGTRGIESGAFSNVLNKYIEIAPEMKVTIEPIVNSTPLEVKWKDRQIIKKAFGKVEEWCHNKDNKIDKDYNKICLDVFDYTAGDRSTIVNLIP